MSVTNADLEAHLARVEEIVTPRPNWWARAGIGALALLVLYFAVANFRLNTDAAADRKNSSKQIEALTTAVRELEAQVRSLCMERLDQTTSCKPVTSIPTPIPQPTPGVQPSPSPGSRGPQGPQGQGQPSLAPTPSSGRGESNPPSTRPTTRPTSRPTTRPTRTPSPSPSPTPVVKVCVLGICLPPDDLLAMMRSAFR